MAIINKTGITNGGTIQAEHITRAIDALSGVSTDTIVATGSFSGSLVGIATSASFATTASFAANATSFPFTGSARITGSLAVTGSTTLNGSLGGSITGSSTMIMNLGTLGSSGNFILPTTAPSTPTRGSVYWDFANNYLYIHNGAAWTRVLFTLAG
jgi:hypothetical protein